MFNHTKGLPIRQIKDLCIIAIIIIYSLLRFFIIAKGQLVGGAYFFSSYDFILLFLISVPFAILDVTSNMVRVRIENNSYRNAQSVLYFSMLIGIIFAIAVSSVILLFRDAICNQLLTGKNCVLCVLLLLPLTFFMSVSSAIKGFLNGAGLKIRLYLTSVVEIFAMFIGVFAFSNAFTSYGSKVASVLYDAKINSAFFSAGVALGLSVGALAGMIISIVMFILSKNELLIKDNTKRLEDIYDIGSKMASEILVLGFANSFLLLFNFINQVIYLRLCNMESTSQLLYNFGSYYSALWSVIICPLLFTFIYAFFDRKPLRAGYREKNKSEIRAKISQSEKQFYIYSIPFCCFILIMAEEICTMTFGLVSELTERLIRWGCFTIVFLGLGIILMNTLICIKRLFVTIISGAIALSADIAVLIILLTRTDLGIYSLLAATYVFSFCYALINYLAIMKYMKYKPKFKNNLLRPIIGGVVVLIVSFLLKLVLGLFASASVVLVADGVITFLILFITYAKTGAFSYHSLNRSPLGFILVPLGKLLRLYK